MELMFANAWVLYFLWLIPLMLAALIAAIRRRESRIAAFVAPVMQKRLRPKSDLTRQTWQSILLAAGLLLCMIALARPQWGRTEQRVFSKGRDIVIALDVSRSMLANDVHPNRLERAKIDIMDLLNDIEGDRAALLAFRHKAVPLCPLTTDYAFLRHILDMAGLHSAPQGETDIGSAIDHAVEMLLEDEGSHKAILMVSDGEDLHGKAVAAAKKAAARGIPIFTVGYGRTAGSTIPDKTTGTKLKYRGEIVTSKLDNETLYEIAKVTGGAYVPIQTASTAQTTLGAIYRDHFSRIAARELEENITFGYSERFHYFLLPGVILLIATAFLSKGRLAGGAKKAVDLKDMNPGSPGLKPLALFALFILPVVCLGSTNAPDSSASTMPEGRNAARRAQRLYEKGKLEEAASLYLRAARTITGPARESFTYNAAVSLFEAGKHSEAVDVLNTISGEGSIPRDRLDMALGTAHYRSKDSISETNAVKRLQAVAEALKNSAEHFAEASRLKKESHADAVNNLSSIIEAAFSARKEADSARLMEEHADADAFTLLDKMLTAQRSVMEKAAEAYTTDDPSQIQLLEDLAAKQKANADLWIPLKQKLGQAAQSSTTNRTSIEALEKMAEEIESTMRDSAEDMKDLESSGYHRSALSEDGVYRIWKGAAPFSNLLSEDLRRQSNALTQADSPQLQVRDQEESRELTDLFRRRFKEAFPENQAQQPAAETEDTMTPEKRAQILDLADLTVKTQEQALAHLRDGKTEEAAERQAAALANLAEIQSLLPKQKQDNQQQDNQDQQDQEDPQDNQQPPPDEPEKDPEDREPQDPEDNQEEPEPKQQPENEDKDGEMSESEVKRLLDKALQREKQHEIEKREKSEFIPPKMIDRDW